MDKSTPDQGNCSFQAVMQQLERPEIAILNVCLDHKHIRKCVCYYAIECSTIELANFKVNFDEVASAKSFKKWDCFFNEMRKPRFRQKAQLFKSQLGYYVKTY